MKKMTLQGFKSLIKNIIKEEYKSLNEDYNNNTFTFGKYKSKTIEEVFYENPSYLIWFVENVDPKTPKLNELINNIKNFIEINKDKLPKKKDPNSKKINLKTVKIYVPNEGALRTLTRTPTLNQWVRSKLKVGDNYERVNHTQFHNIKKMYSLVNGVTVEDVTDTVDKNNLPINEEP